MITNIFIIFSKICGDAGSRTRVRTETNVYVYNHSRFLNLILQAAKQQANSRTSLLNMAQNPQTKTLSQFTQKWRFKNPR